jgi:DNA-binding NarL/FixJ family response regulator
MNATIKAKLNDAWDAAGKAFAKEPLIFIDSKGSYWLNSHAKEYISKREIPVDDLMGWLKIGSAHLQNLSYKDTGFQMMHLPGDNVVVILKEKTPDNSGCKARLTSKEREILRYLVEGKSNKEIATAMKIAPGTVNSHLDNIYMKLDCTNRVTACFVALKNGLFLPVSRSAKRSEK